MYKIQTVSKCNEDTYLSLSPYVSTISPSLLYTAMLPLCTYHFHVHFAYCERLKL